MSALLVPTPDGFLRGGQPHQIISGAIHYFRVHPQQWRDRLRRLVAMGCNAVETYVAWNIHQPTPDTVTFDGIADLGCFLDIAAEEGLDAIVRPGPYICAEWENGGFPGWLIADPTVALRTRDPRYLRAVDSWFDALIPVIAQRQACHGGPVVMVQVENEYGSYGDDTAYLEHLRDGLRARGISELLVTSDGPASMWLTGGTVDGALATVNFGSRTTEVLEMAAEELPDQPLMCMEFWNGWFDHWGEEHHTRTDDSAAEELVTMLEAGMSVNFYMAHGGTNHGLWAGANHPGTLQPTTTSYDYDAPIAEDGTLTAKFHAFREVIARHRDLPPLESELERLGLSEKPVLLPEGEVRIEKTVPLRSTPLFTRPAPVHPKPPTFEELQLERGMLRLAREVEMSRSAEGEIAPLQLHGLRDRAWVFLDGRYVGAVGVRGPEQPQPDPTPVSLTDVADALLAPGERRTMRLEILVANLGRTNFGPKLGDRKGILGGVWHVIRYLNDWEVDPWPLPRMAGELGEALAAGTAWEAGNDGKQGGRETLAAHDGASATDGEKQVDGPQPPSAPSPLPVLVQASFTAEEPACTYLDVSDCGHGVAWVNGECVGRFWGIGPQQTLYVPAPLVRAGRNEVLLLDLERVPQRLALTAEHRFHTP